MSEANSVDHFFVLYAQPTSKWYLVSGFPRVFKKNNNEIKMFFNEVKKWVILYNSDLGILLDWLKK